MSERKDTNLILNEWYSGSTNLTARVDSNAILNAWYNGTSLLSINLNNIKTLSGQTTDNHQTTIGTISLDNNTIYNLSIKGVGCGASSTPGDYASYTGTPPGCTTAITITADNIGLDGNNILLNFDGAKTITQIISGWNIAYPTNTCTLTGDGTQIPNNKEKIQLSGGTSETRAYTAINVVGTAKNENGTISVDGVTISKLKDDYTNCSLTIQAGTGTNLNIAATGISATTINWSAKVEWQDIAFE